MEGVKMKHENALNKLCPMTPRGDYNDNNRCVASGCMAWRWFNTQSGYCGLAGKPENSAGSGKTRKTDATEEVVKVIEKFVKDCCVACTDKIETPSKAIYSRFKDYSSASISQKVFGSIFSRRFKSIKRSGYTWYQGIKLK
jgi:hypothetical protein